jgi:hypothetical protein
VVGVRASDRWPRSVEKRPRAWEQLVWNVRRTVVTVTVLALLGACSGPAAGHATSSPPSDSLAVWREFAACARTHGVPGLPDPRLDAEGNVHFPGVSGTTMPGSVRAACAPLLDRLPAQDRPSAAPTDIPALLEFARCLRQHGFPDWPDPKPDGTFPSAELPTVKTPAFVAAMQACDQLNPDRGGHIYGS